MELQEYNREQLLYIIQEQNKQIHTLTAERAWLIEDNNLQRDTVAKCQQKIAEWQSYAQYRKNQAETLAQEVKEQKEKSAASLNSAVEELGALKAEHLALLGKYEAMKQQLNYGIHLGRAMYEEYLMYKTSYIALLQQFNTTTEDDIEVSKITLQEQETPEPTMRNNAYAVVQYNKRKTAPPEAWSDFIINIKMPSSAKIRFIVNIRSEPPRLHCACLRNSHLHNPTKGKMLALRYKAVVSNQDKVVKKRGLYEQNSCALLRSPVKASDTECMHLWKLTKMLALPVKAVVSNQEKLVERRSVYEQDYCGDLRSPVKAPDTECQNNRGTKSSSAGEHQKVGKPSSKVNRKETITKKKAQSVFHFLSLLKAKLHFDGGTEILLKFLIANLIYKCDNTVFPPFATTGMQL